MIVRSLTENKNGNVSLHCTQTPFPLMGKGRDRGAPNDQSITPTLLLPRSVHPVKEKEIDTTNPTIQWPCPNLNFRRSHSRTWTIISVSTDALLPQPATPIA